MKIVFLMLMFQGLFVKSAQESKINDSFPPIKKHKNSKKKVRFQEVESNVSRFELIQLAVRDHLKLEEGLTLLREHDKDIPTLADFIEQNLEYDQDENFDESINENRLNFGEVIQQAEDILLIKMKSSFVEIIEKLIESHKNIHVIEMLHSQYVVDPVKISLKDFIIRYSLPNFSKIVDHRFLTQIADFNDRPLDEKISIQDPIFEYVIKHSDKFMKPILKNWVNCNDRNNTTLLQKTLQHNNPTFTHLLIGLGADITNKNEHGQTLLHEAASLNLVEILDILISSNELAKKEQSKYPIKKIKIMNENDQDDQGQTALHVAVQSDAKNVITMLLGRYVDESILDNKGFDALSLAIYSKKIAITEMLLITQFSQSLLRSKNDYCLTYAWNGILNRHENHSELTSLKNWCDKEDVALMQMLLDKGVRLKNANFILHSAIYEDLTDIGLMLLNHNVNVNVQPENQNSMLCHGVKNNNEAIVERLIAKSANIHGRDIQTGETFLSLAVLNAHQNIIKMLLDSGVNINEVDDQGQTALHKAAQLNLIEIAKILVTRGIDLNITDNLGHTAEELAQVDEMKTFFTFAFLIN